VVGAIQHGPAVAAREPELLARAEDVQVLLRAHVGELMPDANDRHRIAGVRALIDAGRWFTVKARVTVLAAGGIGNARLLLLGNADSPAGIGNQHDLVGRFFMEHLALRAGVIVPDDPALLERRDLFGVSEIDGAHAVRILALSEEVVREEELLNTYFNLDARPYAFTPEGVRSASTFTRVIRSQPLTRQFPVRAARAVAATPAVVRAVLASRRPPDVLLVRVQAEQAPNRDSRVTLSTRRNRFGVRMTQLDWRILPADTRSIRRTQEILGAELREAGIGRLEDLYGDQPNPIPMAGHYHHLGTTRMHEDPRHGVVDSSGRVHDTSDLYVTGGSVFPTGGAANPTLTIVALALRLGDELETVLARP
jgi:choline dehydrogenase-like flavoprotein